MRTPREAFLVSGNVAEFKKVVANTGFEPACEYALLQLAMELAPTTIPGMPADPYIAIDANSQLHGARRVLEILQSLHEPIKPPTRTEKQELNYAR